MAGTSSHMAVIEVGEVDMAEILAGGLAGAMK